ncbi:MAG: AAA family ATPase [Clostridium beijerinckii]|nr:AAA family ATPase [Clostridium beijerinckii]MCI1583480.1 AAA family ATPase [Clostridium beijerinckii]MCI1623686.1 AAA family ATPase [Clostridium beijerinckii]
MGVNITVVGADLNSDEYRAATRLKDIICSGVSENTIGEITIFSSATLYGQTVKDIDLFMIGMIQNYSPLLNFFDSDGIYKEANVDIHNFCTTIEVKSHSINGISREGTNIFVEYGKRKHCVTEQSNKQKIAAKNFFESCLKSSPYITNLIWFVGSTKNEINNLLSEDYCGCIKSNILGSEFSLNELMQLLIWQKDLRCRNGRYYFDSIFSGQNVDNLLKALNLFSKVKKGMGELTRKKIELITRKSLGGKSVFNNDSEISIYRGRAGTGKTIGLIQTAVDLVDNDEGRILILTYNNALVSDIKRLFALTELPDLFNANCITIRTMHSFFYNVINCILYSGTLNSEDFLKNYYEYITEINEYFMEDGITKDEYTSLASKDININWDYVLIDEAQDWSNYERDLIINLFNKGHILVADGGQQFVRNSELCDWSIIKNRNNIKLKCCLRQKENLISFLNIFSQKYLDTFSNIRGSNDMVGGKVIVFSGNYLESKIHDKEINELHNYGNTNYDMLYLVPPTFVKSEDNQPGFKYKYEYEKKGIFMWDGTNIKNRHNYSINIDEVRLLQYESSRGLEAWSVICLEFDEFLKIKENQYEPKDEKNNLLLESEDEKKKKYLYNWAMIPLTRAIDTLVITLKNEESDVGKILKEIAKEHPDYVLWM